MQYEDNTDIAIGEVVEIQWKVSVNGAVFVNAGNKVTTCQQVIDLTKVADSDYIYKATAWARAKESVLSAEFVSVTVKRLPNPKTVTGISGQIGPAAGSL